MKEPSEEYLTEQLQQGRKPVELIKEVIPVGTILMTSWGYDMTINDYCVVKANTGKTVKCVMLKKKVEGDTDPSGGSSIPLKGNEKGKTFNLKVVLEKWRGVNDTGRYHLSIRGSYPYAEGDKRFGYFSIWEGRPDAYNTWD